MHRRGSGLVVVTHEMTSISAALVHAETRSLAYDNYFQPRLDLPWELGAFFGNRKEKLNPKICKKSQTILVYTCIACWRREPSRLR